MATELDHQSIKERIVEILKDNTNLYDPTNNPGNKVRSIDLGVPDQKEFTKIPTPYIRVTNSTDLENDKPFGPVVSNTQSASYHVAKYLIICVSQAKDGKTVEGLLDDLHKLIKETMKANVDLRNPDTGVDAKCKVSFPIKTEQLGAGQYSGKSLDGFVITLQIEQVTN